MFADRGTKRERQAFSGSFLHPCSSADGRAGCVHLGLGIQGMCLGPRRARNSQGIFKCLHSMLVPGQDLLGEPLQGHLSLSPARSC